MGHILHAVYNPIRDAVETGAVLGGNYLLPGSSLLTKNLASKGSQEQLDSTLGRVANIGTGLAGSGIGESITGIPSAASQGAGWLNAANGAGNLVGAGNIGTAVNEGATGLFNSATNGLSNALSGVGAATGLSDVFGGSGASAGGEAASSSPGFFSRLFGESAGTPLSGGVGPTQGSGALGAATRGLSGLSSALSTGTGGGSSSYGGLGTAAALLGGVNSLSANDKAQKDLLAAQSNALGQLDPYLESGKAANSRLSDLLGTGTNTGASDFGTLAKPYTPEDLQNDPGYKFQLEQGNQAIDRKASASGNYFSGSALKAAQDYGQGLADTTYKDAYARDQANKAQQYGMLSGQAGSGLSAANAAAGINESTGNSKAAAGISSSNILNQTLSSLLSGSGAKRFLGYSQSGQPLYA